MHHGPLILRGDRMSKRVLTYGICHAAGMDAGQGSMVDAGRKCWNEIDYNVCAREQNRLLDTMDVERKGDVT